MKRLKKMMALVIAMVMVLSMTSMAFATTPTGGLTVDDHISVKALQEGDSVGLYKVLAWNDGWKAVAPFESLTPAEVEQILGKPADNSTTPPTAAVPSNITAALAEKIAKLATGAAKYTAEADSTGEAKQENPEAGLYVGIITPAKSGYVYNPVFVGADYSRTSGTNEWTVNTELSYSDSAMAKKADVKVEKFADTTGEALEKDSKSGTVAVGETVTFYVNTTIPEFADNYTNPVFNVKDVLSAGLELDTTSIKVYEGTYKTMAEVAAAGPAPGNNTLVTYTATQYSTTDPAPTKTGYTVKFNSTWIKGLTVNTPVTIEYKAKVTSEALKSVNEEDNTVTVNYSNAPSDETGHGILKDKTNHYTFDIDGNLWGEQPYKATEVVKVGIDAEGNEITETITLDNGKTVGALQGAEFKLYTDQACENEYTTTDTRYVSPIVTDAQGRMTIKGLDAGVYYIKETKAPDGYIKDTTAHKIEIKAVIEEVAVTELYDTSTEQFVTTANDNTIEVKYSVPTLKSYTVEIDGVETASYTIQTDATSTKITSQSAGDTVVGTDTTSGKIKNKKGVELPSTGGIGTTMFYIIGAILVLGAGVVLITRRRMDA